MTVTLGTPPQQAVIPVTRGCDRGFTIRRVDENGDPLNYPAGVTMYLLIDIDRDNPTRVDALISGSTASFTISDAVCDQVTGSTRWRAIFDQGSLETPLLVGRFTRHDG